MKHLPTIAGLKMFCPNPPNTIFPNITPKTIPAITMKMGIVGGRESEYIKHVTKTADVTGLPFVSVNTASVPIPNKEVMNITKRDLHPNRYKDIAETGASAKQTLNIGFCNKKMFFIEICIYYYLINEAWLKKIQ